MTSIDTEENGTSITPPPAPAEHTHEQEHVHSESAAEGEHFLHQHRQGPSLNPELLREIQVEVPAEEVSKSFSAVTKRYRKLARIPGFRAGKVPESLIRSRFAKEVRQEVLENLLTERFRTAVEEQKLVPISQPQMTDLLLVDGQPMTFKAAFEIMPALDVAGYETVQVKRPSVALTAEEFEAELSRVMDSHAIVEPVDEERALVDGDWAEIGFRGEVKNLAQTVTEDGVQAATSAQPITGEDVLIEIGGKNTLSAFNDALRGAKVGQEMTFEVAYPEDFGEPRLAGQTVGYDVTVKSIKRKIFPERDAEFAKQIGDYESWDDFEAKLRDHAAGRKKDALETGAKEQMVEALVGRYQFPVPETFVQQQIDARLDRGLRALAQQGMKAEDMRKLDFNRLREAQRDQAVAEVKASLILDRIAAAEGITVSEEEMDRELLMLSLQSREPLETLRDRLTKDGGLDRIREQMLREKTGSVLYEKLAS